MSGIGHNNGPSMEPGHGFRKVAWTKARAALLPTLPLEVVRTRVARAKRLGLPYRTYATIRATAGHDIVAFLFSGNALDLRPRRVDLPAPVAERLTDLPAGRLAAIYAPAGPEDVLAANPGRLDAAARAPDITASWRVVRDSVSGLVTGARVPRDGVVLVAATALERDWCAAAGLAGIVPAEGFFAPPTD
ncbi:hypothetical protein HKCCE2091_10465 [Rhodobacterales bacterium HKCCE2091]|nr:hypothetical protein [Rhodobacterales bacterium HKCCE2091]